MESEKTGLSLLVSVVVMVFIIGLVIFIFVLLGGSLQDATTVSASGSLVNETITFTNGTGDTTSVAGYNNVQLNNVVIRRCGA